jgi:nucleoside-diphosphate-sugar epimerase
VLAVTRRPAHPSALLSRLPAAVTAPRLAPPGSAAEWTELIDGKGVDLVLHLAGMSQVGAAIEDPPAALAANAMATAILLEGVRRSARMPRVVIASTDGVYGAGDGRPFTEESPLACTTPYETTKLAAEAMARSYAAAFSLPVAIVRFGNIYGPGDRNTERIVPNTVGRALRGERPVLRDGGTSERAFLFVSDAVAGLLAVADLAGEADGRGEAFNVSGDGPVTTRQMIETVLAAVGRPDLQPEIMARPAGQEISRKRSSAARLSTRTGWRPAVPLEEGLARTVAWEVESPGAQSAGDGAGADRAAAAPAGALASRS